MSPASLRTSMLGLAPALALLFALGCECGHEDDDDSTGSTTETTSGTEGEVSDELPEIPAVAPSGPLRWAAILEQDHGDDDVVVHRVFLHRAGTAEGELPESATALGQISDEHGTYTFHLLSEEDGGERHLTVFGIRGTCEAPVTHVLHLRATLDPRHGADEERLYDGLEIEECQGAYPWGVEGEIAYRELSTRTMSDAPEAVREVVQARETAITEEAEDEPMRIVGAEISELGVWVLSGWLTYVVRGEAIVDESEGGIPAAIHLSQRSMLLVRGENGAYLATAGEHRLEPIDVDALDVAPAGAGDEHEADEHEAETH